ncbi:MAG TPA: hypothetical protein VMV49_06130 [Candidatus Deferrimicrobium sp.]|nr:hypothetical protein [Candidatus Deferrimicrobium sp.]
MRIINEVWIINPSGITLFNLSKDERVDPLLIGGFFSAIQSFIRELGEKELKTLILGETKIILFQGPEGYLFISRSSKKVKDETIINYLKLVESKFFEQYAETLKKPIPNTSLFSNFGSVIEEIFEDTPEKRTAEALW